MRLFKKKKNNLDEWQEQKLLHIERNSFWLLYWLLAVTMMIQLLLGTEKQAIFGEWFCFMIASAYMVITCLKNGIWDRYMKADCRTNGKLSLAAGAVVMVLNGLLLGKTFAEKDMKTVLAAAGLSGLCTFLITFTALSCVAAVHKRHVSRMETEEDED